VFILYDGPALPARLRLNDMLFQISPGFVRFGQVVSKKPLTFLSSILVPHGYDGSGSSLLPFPVTFVPPLPADYEGFAFIPSQDWAKM
jgi:hypothetical protein